MWVCCEREYARCLLRFMPVCITTSIYMHVRVGVDPHVVLLFPSRLPLSQSINQHPTPEKTPTIGISTPMSKMQGLDRAVLEREEAKEAMKASVYVARGGVFQECIAVYTCGVYFRVRLHVLLGFWVYRGDDGEWMVACMAARFLFCLQTSPTATASINPSRHSPNPLSYPSTQPQAYAALLGSLREYEAQHVEEWAREVEGSAQVCVCVGQSRSPINKHPPPHKQTQNLTNCQ